MSKALREQQVEYLVCDWCNKPVKNYNAILTTWPPTGDNSRDFYPLKTFKAVWANWFAKVTYHFHIQCADEILRQAVLAKNIATPTQTEGDKDNG